MSIPASVTFHPSWWHQNAGVCFNEEFFFNARYRLEADVKMRKVLYDHFGDLGLGEKNPQKRPIIGSDLIASGYLYSGILGCDIRYSDDSPPGVICWNLTNPEAASLEVPDLERHMLWRNLESQIRELESNHGYCLPCINLMGVQNIALDLRGSELYIDYFENEAIARHILDVCTSLSIIIGRRFRQLSPCVSGGVTSIVSNVASDVYLTSNCSVEMVSLEQYREFLLPFDQKLADEFQPFGIHHCGKTMEHIVEGYAEIRHLAFVEAGAGSDIAAVRKALPESHINARFSPVKLASANCEEMRDDIIRMVSAGAPLSRVSCSCVGIDDQVPDEQIRSFLEICRSIGTD